MNVHVPSQTIYRYTCIRLYYLWSNLYRSDQIRDLYWITWPHHIVDHHMKQRIIFGTELINVHTRFAYKSC